MNTRLLLESVTRHIALTPEEEKFFTGCFLPRNIKPGELLEKPGEPTQYFMFVCSGCLMTYYTDDAGYDHVMQFAMPGWWTGDLSSIMKGAESMFTTRALAESEVLLITRSSLDQLLEKYPRFERFYRILFQNSLITMQGRILQNLSAPAEVRYQNFTKKYPTLEQFVPQKYIASYLGITPEFLSKIRRKLMERP
jgi:CRP-like cAMP-binding protein